MVDPDRVRSLLERLSSCVTSLDRLAGLEPDELTGDPDRIASVKYHFIVAIECCIDIANHLIASEKLRAPLNYADSFNVLIEAGILASELGDCLAKAARFRNRLVHIYWEVDDELVVSYLKDRRRDFSEFARAAAAYAIST